MKRTFLVVLILLAASIPHAATLSWQAPASYTDGTLVAWDEVADMVYIPAMSTGGAWQDLPTTELLWATVAVPPAGTTWYYSCRVMYCPNFVCGPASAYAPSVSYTTLAPTCSYTYSAWSACNSYGIQTRTILSSSPSGCVGTPVVAQSCAYTPPPKPGWGKGGKKK